MICSRISQSIFKIQKASYIRGWWPEPITQQTLQKFLQDINYFRDPKKYVNIGLKANQAQSIENTATSNEQQDTIENSLTIKETTKKTQQISENKTKQVQDINDESIDLDSTLKLLGQEQSSEKLNKNDINLTGAELAKQAINQGIYRDLFGTYTPETGNIQFTQEQADRMNKLIPFFWITDLPFSRVNRHMKDPEPLKVFNPLVNIKARFIRQSDDELVAHPVFYGNIIAAQEGSTKPSIIIDGSLLSDIPISDSNISDNWNMGDIQLTKFPESADLFTLVLLNLDYLEENKSCLHWMAANLKPSSEQKSCQFDELCEYLPVHGINGFGYSRYVFLLLQHHKELDPSSIKYTGFNIKERIFDPIEFVTKHKDINMLPIGLSWFQTCWDESSNKIFHEYLNMKAPTYEHVQEKYLKREEQGYPGRLPFNVYLDHYRDEKDINKQVLVERLKNLDITNYKDQHAIPKVPPTIHPAEKMPGSLKIPDWYYNVHFKKVNKIGYWRGLRPASAIIPLNNNADLDYPIRPVASSKKQPILAPNKYPGNKIWKSKKELPVSLPVTEFHEVFIQEDHEVHLEKAKSIMKMDIDKTKNQKKKKAISS